MEKLHGGLINNKKKIPRNLHHHRETELVVGSHYHQKYLPSAKKKLLNLRLLILKGFETIGFKIETLQVCFEHPILCSKSNLETDFDSSKIPSELSLKKDLLKVRMKYIFEVNYPILRLQNEFDE